MTERLIIDTELSALFRPLTEDEYKHLERSIVAKGCREALITWQGIILDGHNRYRICNEHDIPYSVVEIDLPDRDAAIRWMEENQLGRRNLDPDMYKVIAGRVYNRRKNSSPGAPKDNINAKKQWGKSYPIVLEDKSNPSGAPKDNINAKKQWGKSYPIVLDDKPSRTAEVMAKEYGVSEKTIKNYGNFAESYDQAKEEILSQPEPLAIVEDEALEQVQSKAALAALIMKRAKEINQEERERRKEKKRREAEEREQAKAAKIQSLRHTPIVTIAGYKDWLPKQEMCDLLLTDPPYMTDIDDIEGFASEWLPMALSKVKRTGRAYIFIGGYAREMMAYCNVKEPDQLLIWTYRNTMGPAPTYKYKQNYQAILYYVMPDAPPLDCPALIERFTVQDIATPGIGHQVRYHQWQKPMEIAERFIRHSSKPGDVLLDPFCCTGTFLIAGTKYGLIAKGCDISESNLSIAKKRGCRIA